MTARWGHRNAEELERRGFSILETVIALVILALVIVPLASTFSNLRTGFRKIERNAMALGLARAVMDHIHFRLYNEDTRFTKQLQSDAEKVLAAQGGDGSLFFDSLSESDKRATFDDPALMSLYFVRFNDLTQSGSFGITQANDPDLYRQLLTYRTTVDVYFSSPTDLLDSDVDGKAEIDMAEIKVSISWTEAGQARSFEIWSVFSKRQYNDLQ